MAKRKKATGKTKAKRKKTSVKASTRKKTTTVRKTKPTVKKITRKAPLRGVSPRKAMQISVKPTAVKPTAVKPTPTSRRPQPVPAEQRIGVVTHYYSHLSVATLRLEQVDHAPATEVGPKDDFGLKVVDHAREHDVVFKVRS